MMTATVIPLFSHPRAPSPLSAEVIPLSMADSIRRNASPATIDKAVDSLIKNFRNAQAGDENSRVKIKVIASYEFAPTLSRLAETLLEDLGFPIDVEPPSGPEAA